jgi:putative methionine-R-sulfoxide reductase with GAF domain
MKDLFRMFKGFFTAPVFEGNKEKTQSAKLLYQIIRILWALPILLVTIGILGGRAEVIPPAIVISISLLTLMVLSQIGWVGLASTCLTAMIILLIGYADFQNAGNIQPSTLMFAIAIIMSGLLLGKRAPLVTAIVILISHTIIVYFQMQGLIELSSAPAVGIENIIITSIMILMIAFLFQFVIARLQSALDEARKNESELQISNRQLEESRISLEQRVADRTKDLAIVAEVGTATSTILEVKNLLQEVVDLTKERFSLYHSHIYLLDEAGENLVLASGAGEPGRQMVAEGRSIPLDREQSLVARAARERSGVTVNDVTQVPDFLPNPLLPNTRSELAVPMIVGGKVIGVFDVQSDIVGRFTDSDINIQTTLASQVATSIQNVRSFEQSKTQADFESLVNTIGQKIQRATTVEDTLQTAIRELGRALGATRVRARIGAGQQANGNESNSN